MGNILVVDDEPALLRMVADCLEGAGHAVRGAADGTAMRCCLNDAPADLVVLDRRLPDEDGMSLLAHLRAHHDLGVVMLTGADALGDRLAGLDGGADDYLTKPFSPRELLARVEAVLRRRRWAEKRTLPFGPFTLDLKGWRLLGLDGSDLGLIGTEIDLLVALASHPGRVLEREDILRLAPGRGEDALERSVDTRLARLRRKLEEAGASSDLIRTARGSGYVYGGA